MTIAIIAEITGNMTKNSNFHDNVEEMSFSLVFFSNYFSNNHYFYY